MPLASNRQSFAENTFLLNQSPSIRRKDFSFGTVRQTFAERPSYFVLFAEHLLKDLEIFHCSPSIRRQTWSFCSRPSARRAFAEIIRLAFAEKALSDWLIINSYCSADMSNESWDALSDLAAILKNIFSDSQLEFSALLYKFKM